MFEILKKGDTIGVIAPSSPVGIRKISEAINQSVLLLESAGFHIQFGKNVFSHSLGYSATPKEKAQWVSTICLQIKILN